jgi:hypothetical protein
MRQTGIGGWLVLPAIGFVLGPIISAGALLIELTLFSNVELAGYGALYVLGLLVQAGLWLFSIYSAMRFFGEKRNAPSSCIALMIAGLVSSGALLVIDALAGAEPFVIENAKQMAFGIITAAIWIPYFKVSKRVKLTFVN